MIYCISQYIRYLVSYQGVRKRLQEVEVKHANTAAENAVGVKRGSTFQAFRGAALAFYQPEFGIEETPVNRASKFITVYESLVTPCVCIYDDIGQ